MHFLFTCTFFFSVKSGQFLLASQATLRGGWRHPPTKARCPHFGCLVMVPTVTVTDGQLPAKWTYLSLRTMHMKLHLPTSHFGIRRTYTPILLALGSRAHMTLIPIRSRNVPIWWTAGIRGDSTAAHRRWNSALMVNWSLLSYQMWSIATAINCLRCFSLTTCISASVTVWRTLARHTHT